MVTSHWSLRGISCKWGPSLPRNICVSSERGPKFRGNNAHKSPLKTTKVITRYYCPLTSPRLGRGREPSTGPAVSGTAHTPPACSLVGRQPPVCFLHLPSLSQGSCRIASFLHAPRSRLVPPRRPACERESWRRVGAGGVRVNTACCCGGPALMCLSALPPPRWHTCLPAQLPEPPVLPAHPQGPGHPAQAPHV